MSRNHFPGKKDAGVRTSLACPHCQRPLRVRSSRSLSPLVRQLLLACYDPECGATFNGDLTINYAVSPSARPNAAVHLRTAPPRTRPANDDTRAPANDDGTVPANDDAPIDDSGSEVPLAAIGD